MRIFELVTIAPKLTNIWQRSFAPSSSLFQAKPKPFSIAQDGKAPIQLQQQKISAPFRNSKTAIYLAGNFVVCFGSILAFWMKNATHVERHARVWFYLARPYPTACSKPFLWGAGGFQSGLGRGDPLGWPVPGEHPPGHGRWCCLEMTCDDLSPSQVPKKLSTNLGSGCF